MVRHRILALALVFALAAAAPAAAEGFLTAYEDLPLAPGLAEVAGSGMSFDSPGGRIVEAYAQGKVRPADILKFYATTLPQLGWSRESDTLYRREAEVLRLAATAEGRGALLRIDISPE